MSVIDIIALISAPVIMIAIMLAVIAGIVGL
jgi:hypothetical protein